MQIIAKENNIRIDKYLADKLNKTRSKVQKMINEGFVLIDEETVSNNYKVKLNDEIEVLDYIEQDTTIEKENIEIDVVYEDNHLLIINKKSGMVVHPAIGNYKGTLVNALLYKFSLSNKESARPGIVHRLDKDTSGLMIVAKDDETHELISDMLKNKKIERKYYALVNGTIPHETGTIDAPIGRDTVNRQKMMVTNNNSKDSVTHFRVIEKYKNNTLIECKLETGRTHQIRVHLNYIGHSVYNDPIYNNKKATEFGQFLHSHSIKFIHPITKKEIYFEQQLPKEFQDYLDELNEENK